MPAYWDERQMEPPPDETLTSAVGTVERVAGLLAEEAALRRNKKRATAKTTQGPEVSRDSRSGANDEAAAAVGTAARGHRRGGQASPDSRDTRGGDLGRGSGRRGPRQPGRGSDREEER